MLVATAGLLALSAAPGAAATPVAQARASAITLTLGGQAASPGDYRVSNDGTRESASGTNQPALSALGGQSLIQAGTLAQDARTQVVDGQGYSAACAGLAGQGATVVGVGNGATCLTPGQAVTIGAGNLDLSGLQLATTPLLQGLDAPLQAALGQIIPQLTTALQGGVAQALNGLDLGVDLDFGAVQSSCTAGPGTASGTARLAGARATVQVGGQSVSLLDFPIDPAPNTKLVTGLGDVSALVLKAVETQLAATLSNLPGGLVLPVGVDQASVLTAALNQISAQLKPLQDNVLDVTLNKQTRTGNDQIEVTALDVTLLPVAQQQFGVTAFNLRVGTSACGPSGKVAAAPSPTPTATPTPDKTPPPKVPTSVPAGLESAETSDGWVGPLALVGLLAIAVGALGAAARRS